MYVPLAASLMMKGSGGIEASGQVWLRRRPQELAGLLHVRNFEFPREFGRSVVERANALIIRAAGVEGVDLPVEGAL